VRLERYYDPFGNADIKKSLLPIELGLVQLSSMHQKLRGATAQLAAPMSQDIDECNNCSHVSQNETKEYT